MQIHLLHLLFYLSLLGSLFAFEPRQRQWAKAGGHGGDQTACDLSCQALQKILAKTDEHEGCGAWESVGTDMLVCMSKFRFCSTIESLPVQCQLQLLLHSAAGVLPNRWRGYVVSIYSLSFISLSLGSDPGHAVPSFTLDEFGVFFSCAPQGYPAQPVTSHMPGMGVKPCCHESQLLPGPVCLLIMDNLFSQGLLPPLPASDSVGLKSASTSVLPEFWLGQQPHCQHTQASLQGRAWDAQPGSVTLLNLAQSHHPARTKVTLTLLFLTSLFCYAN